MNTLSAPDKLDLVALAKQMDEEGFVRVRGLFSPEEVAELETLFATIHRDGVPGRYEAKGDTLEPGGDPLEHWPRVMHPHRYDNRIKDYMLHPRVQECLTAFLTEEPAATQSMYYFKPPGARGQALHQDNFYLMVQPGTCMAAWTAIDACDAENGAMMVVPGSHRDDIACPEKANPKVSFTTEFVPVPKGKKPVLVTMEPGDTLFFNGALIHGSGPNRSQTRFRRSFICHYAAGSTERISNVYLPLIRMDGSEFQIPAAIGGGPCGTEWTGGAH